jgi:hypothetical protein
MEFNGQSWTAVDRVTKRSSLHVETHGFLRLGCWEGLGSFGGSFKVTALVGSNVCFL